MRQKLCVGHFELSCRLTGPVGVNHISYLYHDVLYTQRMDSNDSIPQDEWMNSLMRAFISFVFISMNIQRIRAA